MVLNAQFSTKTAPAGAPAGAPAATTTNASGRPAFELGDTEALAQFALTGCLNDCFYTKAEDQLETVLRLCANVAPDDVATIAIYAREHGRMKDLPALLVAFLALSRSGDQKAVDAAFHRAFPRAINNGRQLRGFVQFLRSGKVGDFNATRKGSVNGKIRNAIQQWFKARTADQIFRDSIGNDPSLADVLKLAHPHPGSETKRALYGYITGNKYDESKLPATAREMIAFARSEGPMPERAPFMMLSAHLKTRADWIDAAARMSWVELTKNLQTLARHGVFDRPEVTHDIAELIRDGDMIRKSGVFPYQILTAYKFAEDAPMEIRSALQDALDLSLVTVPALNVPISVAVDCSQSMTDPITGKRGTATTKVRCVDVAALIASALMRQNPRTRLIPFDTRILIHPEGFNPRDSVVTNALKIARLGGGGTACSLPLAMLNSNYVQDPVVVFVSDNESWADASGCMRAGFSPSPSRTSPMMEEWHKYRSRVRGAKLITIDLTPNTTSQVARSPEILRIGGFSDSVFDVIAEFVAEPIGSRKSALDVIRSRV